MDFTATVPQSSLPVATVIALVLALVGAIVASLLFFNPQKRKGYKGVMQKLCAHVNFDRFLIASILKFLYVFGLLYCVVSGLIQVFTGSPLAGLILAALAPVGLRVVFEQLLLLLSMRDELREGNDLLRRMQGLPPKNAPQPQPQSQQGAQQRARADAPDPRYQQQRPASYPPQGAGYGGYPQRPPQTYPTEFGMTQRYAPIRDTGYGKEGYELAARAPVSAAPGNAAVRPTPADGTGRFSALPRRDGAEADQKTPNR